MGLAYHVGVLRALEEVGGFVPNSADLVVGTSAGSVIAAYIRSGWTPEDLWKIVLSGGSELPPAPESASDMAADSPLPELFVVAFHTPVELVRRSLGSAFVLARSLLRTPLPSLPGPLRRAFPAGLFEMAGGRRRFDHELPDSWPDRATWLCAVDIVSGRRMVLGRRRPPQLTLPQAVMASCAIPGAYPPVRYGRRELIDGGAHSSSNLDLGVDFGADLIIGVVPMGYDQVDPPGCSGRLLRRIANRSLDAELAGADRQGSRVFLIRPTAAEVRLHGVNFMRSGDLLPLSQAAYDATARRLESGEFSRFLDTAA